MALAAVTSDILVVMEVLTELSCPCSTLALLWMAAGRQKGGWVGVAGGRVGGVRGRWGVGGGRGGNVRVGG